MAWIRVGSCVACTVIHSRNWLIGFFSPGTKEIQLATTKIGDHVVRFIDTPGFDDTDTKDSDILRIIWEHISSIEGLRLSGLLYLHRITDDRVGGTAMKNLRMFQKLVGDKSMKNVVLVTTMWGKLQSSDDGDARVKQLTETGKFWGGMITSGARHERYDGTKVDAHRIIHMMLDNAPCKLQIQEELDHGQKLANTTAGKEVADRLETLKAHHTEEIAGLTQEFSQADQRSSAKIQQGIQTLHRTMVKQRREMAEAEEKLQQAEFEVFQARVEELKNMGGCIVC